MKPQYKEGETFEEERAECCETGFHACQHPLDCFSYHAPNKSVYHEVELDDDIDTEGSGDSKVAATKITVGARLTIAGLVKAAIDFTMSKVKKETGSDEKHGFASATGDYGASSACNSTAVAVAWGHEAKAKGVKGAHLVLSDWKYIGECYCDGDYKTPYDKDCWELIGARMVIVDGETIKEDTYYRCINREVVEAD